MVKRFVLGRMPFVFSTNCYLIEQNGECIVIDAALSRNEIEQYVDSRNLKLIALVLTHGHFDHSGGAKKLMEKYGCPLYCSKKDSFWTEHASENEWSYPAESVTIDENLTEGLLKIGNFTFNVMETAGHSEGSVCIFWQDYLFSGDTLFYNGIGRTDFFDSSDEKMQSSLKRLAAIKEDYKVFSGHGEPTSLAQEKRNNPCLKRYVD